jgi:hypothetical protein
MDGPRLILQLDAFDLGPNPYLRKSKFFTSSFDGYPALTICLYGSFHTHNLESSKFSVGILYISLPGLKLTPTLIES